MAINHMGWIAHCNRYTVICSASKTVLYAEYSEFNADIQ